MVRDCPKCGLVNPPTAEQCDCGYAFATGRMEESYLTDKDHAALASQRSSAEPINRLVDGAMARIGLVVIGAWLLFCVLVAESVLKRFGIQGELAKVAKRAARSRPILGAALVFGFLTALALLLWWGLQVGAEK
jgi:hypothetical protein